MPATSAGIAYVTIIWMASGRSTLPPVNQRGQQKPKWTNNNKQSQFNIVLLNRFPPHAELCDRTHQGSVRSFTSAIRTLPSLPRNVLSIRPRGQCDRGTSSLFKRMRSPSLRFLFSSFHFERIVKVGRRSLCHLHHIMSASAWAILHLSRLLISCSSKWPGGRLGDTRPMRKWFGVIAL